MATFKTRDDIIKEMQKTRGTVFHNGIFYRKPEDVPSDDILAGDDPAARDNALRDLRGQAEQLRTRIARLEVGPRAAPQDLALHLTAPAPAPPQAERKSPDVGEQLADLAAIRARLDSLEEENKRLRLQAAPPENPPEEDAPQETPPENVDDSPANTDADRPPEVTPEGVSGPTEGFSAPPAEETPPAVDVSSLSPRGRRRGI